MSFSGKAHPNGPDDQIEADIYACLNLSKPRSFFLYAGAGSGKTRSLVTVIKRFIKESRRPLLLHGRRIAVITYTNAACDEIKKRLEFDPLVEVCTIHSFSWSLIDGFHVEIREWLRSNLQTEIAELQQAAAKGRPGTRAAIDRERSIASKQRRLERIDSIRRFIYSPTGDNRGRDALNHSEVIKITAHFISSKDVFKNLLVSRYPILFIDESQDTNKDLMDAFLTLQKSHKERFCLGLFGDMMQRIYADGKLRLEEAIPKDWAVPEKKLNHRCPTRIIRLINRIRRDVDKHEQIGRPDKIEGVVRLFLLPNTTANSPAAEKDIASRMATISGDTNWESNCGYKTLILEHQMAARRMGFDAMFSPLYKAESLRMALIDGKLSGLRLFSDDVLPTIQAARRNDSYSVAETVRNRSPLLSQKALSTLANGDQLRQVEKARSGVEALVGLWEKKGAPTFQDVLNSVVKSSLFDIPEALQAFAGIDDPKPDPATNNQLLEEDLLEQEKELTAWREFLETPFDQIGAYSNYVTGISPFETHQGIKGLEFPRVMVVVSDDEARGFLFSYDKLFGAKAKSSTDLKHESAGEETTIDRTRRLFYVTCSRAENSLAIAAYSENPNAVKQQVLKEQWFEESEILIL